jgi:hypothetical protein
LVFICYMSRSSFNNKRLKIPKELSEDIAIRRTDNTMVKRKKGQKD